MPASDSPSRTPSVVIVGGGYSGASAAIQLLRRSPRAIAVTLIESRSEAGRGLAYSAPDPDHRLNAPLDRHALDPDRPDEFAQWYARRGLPQQDPQATWPDGRCFARRWDFGSHAAELLRTHARMPSGSTLALLRDTAVDASREGQRHVVRTAAGQTVPADLMIVATGNPLPRLPACVAPELHGRERVIDNPMDVGRIVREVAPGHRVLVLGAGLTALDVLATLHRQGHRGPITVVSRRGLRPLPQPSTQELQRLRMPPFSFDRIDRAAPDFVRALGPQPPLRALTRALRTHAQAEMAQGRGWQAAFAEVRDVLWQIWPGVPLADKQRFVRHLKVWYDVHRYPSPLQTEAIVQAMRESGAVRWQGARVEAIEADAEGTLRARLRPRSGNGETILQADALINCTGVDGLDRRNPLLAALLDRGWLQPGPAGLGVAVDARLRALARDGSASEGLRVLGPPTLGQFGDPIGAAYIATHVRRSIPDWLATLEQARTG